jgi:hypothetical protein
MDNLQNANNFETVTPIRESQKGIRIICFFPEARPPPECNQFTNNKEIHAALISAQGTILPTPPLQSKFCYAHKFRNLLFTCI